MYRWRDGWTFTRIEGGAVGIDFTRPDGPPRGVEVAVIPPNEWASIVAAVSLQGEDADSFAAADYLHSGRQRAVPDPLADREDAADASKEG